VASGGNELGFALIDFDNHYYEPDDCFTRHLASADAGVAVNIRRRREGGMGRVFIGDDPYKFYRVTQTDYIAGPGAFRDYFDGKTDKPDIADRRVFPRDIPSFMQAEARLEEMDSQQVDAAVLFPTLFISVADGLCRDATTAYANLKAFNRWLEEDWGYDNVGRIFAAPMILLLDPAQVVNELERLLESGARVIGIVPANAGGRSPADPVFDPFWARLAEAGVPAAFHAGDSGFQYLYGQFWSEDSSLPYEAFSPLQHFLAIVERPIVDVLASLVLQNLFGRFPSLRIVSVENGSEWVPGLLKSMDKAFRAHRGVETVGGQLCELPSETFRRHIYVSPFAEDDVYSLIDLIGSDRVLMGSDYPHPEGVAAPLDFAEKFSKLDTVEQRLVLRDNAASLLRLGNNRP
jgi:predicted TIM-barrel fold metal-dependent hydrolase